MEFDFLNWNLSSAISKLCDLGGASSVLRVPVSSSVTGRMNDASSAVERVT